MSVKKCNHDHEHHVHDNHHDHGHGHTHHVEGSFRLLLVILLNIVITAVEYIGGVLSGSLALISDAGHNFSDVLSLVLGYAGEKVSAGRGGARYTFGLKRFEVLTALINSLTLILIGIFIFNESVERFLDPQAVDLKVMLPVAFIGLAGNVISIYVLNSGSKSSLNIRAASLHLLFDALSSVAVIVAAVIIWFTSNYWVDVVISCFIGVMIIWSAFGILRESLRIFLQGVPEHIKTDEVYDAILSVEGVESLHGLHIWSINSQEVFLSCHICLEEGSVLSDSVIREINSLLDTRFGINHSAVQVEFGAFCGGHTENCCR
ncbi:MAG TPA: cation diffusion facilitator family transporter [Spirochaetota bacterium]|nr:cation transporter [Spirochaetota bacterium]HQO39523.1 cation diffusion facilitator family transporter [Spirochaetota bacterium]